MDVALLLVLIDGFLEKIDKMNDLMNNLEDRSKLSMDSAWSLDGGVGNSSAIMMQVENDGGCV